MTEDVGRILDIQKFSLHDGPGIRTIVFLKGCPMSCAWCSNPGSRKLPVLQIADPDNPDVVTADSRDYTVDEVVAICLQDQAFYEESGGGVTLSGGEAMVQHRFTTKFLRTLNSQGIHTAIETTGYAAPGIFAKILAQVDLVIIDVKHHDPTQHESWTTVGNELPLRNLTTAIDAGGDVLVRIPVIPGVNNQIADAVAFSHLLAPLGVTEVSCSPSTSSASASTNSSAGTTGSPASPLFTKRTWPTTATPSSTTASRHSSRDAHRRASVRS